MKCNWNAYLSILPVWLREQVDNCGRNSLEELRLRVGQVPELVIGSKPRFLSRMVSDEDLQFCVNMASRYSPWTSETMNSGFITAQGGHRIGICGEYNVSNRRVQSVTNITSLCIRVSRDYPGIAADTATVEGATLIIGRPGSGKTTFLRDMIRQRSNLHETVGVVDERRELFPVIKGSFSFPTGQHTDVLSGCCKADGIEMLIRTMNPRYIAVDEITAAEDCRAVIRAVGCGVEILATAHAESYEEYLRRPLYASLAAADIFKNIIVLRPDKSWKWERKNTCTLNLLEQPV